MKKTLFETLKGDLRASGIGFRQIVAGVLLLMIVMVFVFFSYNNQDPGMTMGAAIEVEGAVISPQQYQITYSQIEKSYAPFMQVLGNSKDQRGFIENQAVQTLVNQELMFKVVQDLGIKVSPEEIIQVITKEYDVFKDKGRFSRERYQGILQANNWTPAQFEKQLVKDKALARAQSLMEIALAPSQLEKQWEERLGQLQKNVEFATWESQQWAKQNPKPALAVKERLKDEKFQTRVKTEFEARKTDLASPEQVHARHILIKTQAQDEASDKKALARIKELQAQLVTQDFAKLAQQFSEDEGSKAKGGDLGFFGRGAMVPEFEKVAFELAPHQISEPVRSNFGYHLIQVLEKKPAQEALLADHEVAIGSELLAQDDYDGVMKKIEELLKAQDRSQIEGLLKTYNIKWQESGWFSLADARGGALASESATQRAWETSAQKTLLPEVVRDGAKVFILAHKGQKKEAPKVADKSGAEAPKAEANLASQRAGETLNQWLEARRKTAKVLRNPQMFRAPAPVVNE